jgi:hypothetical protein
MNKYRFEFDVPVNGRIRKGRVLVRDEAGVLVCDDTADLTSMTERTKLCRRLADHLKVKEESVSAGVEKAWAAKLNEREADQQARRDAAAAPPGKTAR